MGYMFCVTSVASEVDDVPVQLSVGDIYEDDHPYVKALPSFFSELPPVLNGRPTTGVNIVVGPSRRTKAKK